MSRRNKRNRRGGNRDWARELREAERALQRNRESIEATPRGTRGEKPSDYRVGGGVASRKGPVQ